MSVINKMLRDLDARQASSPEISLDSGTRVVRGGSAGLAQKSTLAALRSSRGLRWLSGLLLLLAAGAAAWYVTQETNTPGPKPPQPTTAVVMPAPAPAAVASAPIAAAPPAEQAASAASAPPAQEAPAPAPVAAAAASAAAPMPPAQTPAAKPQPPVLAAIAPAPAASAAAAKPALAPGMPTKPALVVPAKPPAPVLAATPAQPLMPGRRVEAAKAPAAPTARGPQVAVNSQRLAGQPAVAAAPGPADASATGRAAGNPSAQLQRQAAAQETLAQAQSLWALGSREQALDLMREAVAVAERAYTAGSLPADSPVLASLVRELARMELAEGRVGRVLDMLTRLEPALSRQADLWAVRGNAAQRLARHQESVQAYFKALELRPDEPRWMLGAAVSLAAMGRLDAAAEQAEKARAAGAVSPEILTYLRQAGVPLK